MKRLFTILSFFIITFSVYSQNNVFVLVDVSLSVKPDELSNAKQALNEVLTGSQLTKASVSQGSQQDLVNFKMAQGDKLAIAKFGSLQTTLAINPSPTTIQNVNTDVSQVLNSASWTPTDGQTYITLAKAKIAEYAKNHNITKYKLYLISDNIQDDYGKAGKPNYPDDYTRNLAEGYNTSTNPVSESGYTKLKFDKAKDFTLSFSPNVDVSKYTLPGGTPPAIVDTPSGNAGITITSPPEAKKGKEYEVKSETVNINWTCNNCPQGIKYTVLVSQYDGGKFRETKKCDVPTATFKLPDGKFRITVSASNTTASSDYTCISVNTGGYGWLIFLLILIVAGAVGYKIWNDKRNKKLNEFASTKADDIFSKKSGGTTTSNSPNSDYF
jgi:hypothetical protein